MTPDYSFRKDTMAYLTTHCDGCQDAIPPGGERWIGTLFEQMPNTSLNIRTFKMVTRCGNCIRLLEGLGAIAAASMLIKEANAQKEKNTPSRQRKSTKERVYVPETSEQCAATPVEANGDLDLPATLYGSE